MVAERISRKRQRVAPKDSEDDSKKARGRPRVDGQDETAADRRRTQIRLAQRAYRQRKENTISSLNARVATLQSTIEEMNKCFLEFNDKLVTSNLLEPQLVKELQRTTHNFLLLAKASDNSSSTDSDSEPETMQYEQLVRHEESTQSLFEQPQPDYQTKDLDMGIGYVQIIDDSSSGSALSPPEMPLDPKGFDAALISMSNQSNNALSAQEYPDFNDFPLYPSPSADSTNSTSSAELALPSKELPDMNRNSSLLNTLTLKAPYTFSTEETTFSRRLHRAALERGYHLLATSSQRPEGVLWTFRLSLLYHTQTALMERIRRMLLRPVDQPLEFYATPFIHLGGAGTHYPKERKQNTYIIKEGPINASARLEHTDTGYDPGIELKFDIKEYEGEWFDSNDVEGYLRELGLSIDPRSTFAEANVDDNGILVSLLRKNGALPSVSPTPEPQQAWPVNSITDVSGSTVPVSQAIIDDATARLFPELGLGDSISSAWMNDANIAASWLMGGGSRTPEFPASGWSSAQPPSLWDPLDALGSLELPPSDSTSRSKSPSMRRVTIDVSSFVDEIIKSGICLGRAPGFRKKDVEHSLVASIIEVV
ncbi:hypothetical protein BT63DRAFT_414168 [Microthyrium microscopicum]|uniref:BZIP domain-containing protein n=1 Tax=Microthyrium microscopicum TaxID=703497 RepID=A0A6A6UB42_9PEZI|nr:hypothetical protein BT63DRAFT_414168 [Microthyrium microscopicum]